MATGPGREDPFHPRRTRALIELMSYLRSVATELSFDVIQGGGVHRQPTGRTVPVQVESQGHEQLACGLA